MTELEISESEKEKLSDWRAEFSLDFKAESKWREQRRVAADYYDGNQFTEEEKRVLEERGQPPIVVNLIKPRIDTIQGMFLSVPIMMRAYDVGAQDFDKAKYITEALRYIENANEFNEVEREAVDEQLISGRAWYHVGIDFDFDDIEIKISSPESEDVVKDRYSRKQDLSDCTRLYKTIWAEVSDLKKLYPKMTDFFEHAVNNDSSFQKIISSHMTVKLGDQYEQTDTNTVGAVDPYENIFVDSKRKRLRLVQMWYRESYLREFALHDDLDGGKVEITEYTEEEKAALKQLYPGAEYHKKNAYRLNFALFVTNKIIEEKMDIRAHDPEGKFPFVQLLGYTEKNRGKMPYGYVRQLKDPQDAYNKARSKTVHKNNSALLIGTEDAVEDWDEASKEAHRPDGKIRIRPNRELRVEKNQVNNADIMLINLALQEIQGVGIANEMTGQEKSDLSGKAIELRQNQGLQPLRPLLANIRKARKRLFGLVLEEMQRYWTSEKLIKITDDPKAQGIILNQVVTDPNTGHEIIVNDLRLGKYDIKIDEAPQTEGMRKETFDKLLSLVAGLMKMGVQVPLDVFIQLIKSSDVPNKEDIVASLVEQQKIAQAQAQAMAQAQAVAAAQQQAAVAGAGQ